MLAIYVLTSAILVSAASAANHTIVVGGAAGLKFVPDTITAEVGDFVTYIFQSKNHTVTQSTFATPCKLLENATISAVGFNSGFVPVAADAKEFPAWTIEITAKAPIWYYCAQGNHCSAGMVGAINPPATGERTFEAFKKLAAVPASTGGVGYGGYGSAAPAAPSPLISATTTGVNVAAVSSTVLDESQVADATRAGSQEPSTTGTASDTGAGFSRREAGGSVLFFAILGAFFTLL